METQRRSTNKIVEDQVKKWQYLKTGLEKEKPEPAPVVTISREPGSGGRVVAERLAARLGFDLFHQEVVHGMAKDAREFNLSDKDAERRITLSESRRRSFIRKYFNTSIADIYHYDMFINTEKLEIEDAVVAIEAVVKKRMNIDTP